MNTKTTKRALFSSVLAIVLCLAMLIGTTFAWFTDTASTGVNKITSGNLKMKVSYMNDTTEGFKDVTENEKVFDENALWEPGHVEYVVLKVENVGTLALKYKLGINIASETGSTNVLGNPFNLSDYIKFAVIDDDQSALGRTALLEKVTDSKLIKEGYSSDEIKLAASTATEEGAVKDKTVTLVVWMPTTVGNDANYKVGATAPEINLGIDVVATQDTVENDSFGTDYDENATYPATVSAIKAKYGVDGLSMPEGMVITDDKIGDGENGKTFTITLKDTEAFVYFTQVFDRAAAFEAREAQWETEGFTKYPSEYNMANLNMWYGPYCSRITVKMGCDVDLNGMEVKPFGMSGYVFQFDGDGHTIKNAKVTATSGDAGFFMSRANVSNVVLDNIQVSATGCASAGVVAGSPNSNITKVTVKNSSVTGAKYTGAIAGYDYGDITDCVVENTTVCGQYKVGGIVGYVCTDNAEQQRIITGNKLTNVTVKGDDNNIWPDKTSFVIGKIVGNWNAKNGTCKDNTFSGNTAATDNIGETESGCTVQK